MSSVPGGERRTDHRAYAIPCSSCGAAKWRACINYGIRGRGESRAEPHPKRVREEREAKTTPEQRTPTLFEDEEGVLCAPAFNDDGSPNLEGLAAVCNAVNSRSDPCRCGTGKRCPVHP